MKFAETSTMFCSERKEFAPLGFQKELGVLEG